jgi:hypothetical protein
MFEQNFTYLKESFVFKQIRRAERNKIFSYTVGALFVASLFYLFANVWKGVIYGPKEITMDSLFLEDTSTQLKNQRIVVSAKDYFPTGLGYKESQTIVGIPIWSTITQYSLLIDNNHVLLAVVNEKFNEKNSYIGFLKEPSQKIQTDILPELYSKLPELKNAIAPLVLDIAEDINWSTYLWGFAGLLGFIWCVSGIKKTLIIYRNPTLSAQWTSLAKNGSIETIVQNISSEIGDTSSDSIFGNVTLTKNWFVVGEFLEAEFRPLDQVVWAYKTVTTTKAYGLVPVGKTIGVTIKFRDSYIKSINIRETLIEKFFGKLIETRPWIVLGFTKELETLWDTKRQTFIDAVEERKKK